MATNDNDNDPDFWESSANKDKTGEQNKIKRVLVIAKKKNQIQLKTATQRNIIFLGRTRTGKSTLLKVLKDPAHLAQPVSIFSETGNPNLFSFTVESSLMPTGIVPTLVPTTPSVNSEDPPNEMNYNINIIDTPGLYEQKVRTEDIRDNEVIKSMIIKCMEYEITKIHGIFFICSFITGVNKEDLDAFSEFLKLFKGAEKNISMIITHAETLTLKAKDDLRKEILQHPKLAEFTKVISEKIFFFGASSHEDYDRGLVQTVHENLINVMNMRTELYKHIFMSEGYCQLLGLDYFVDKQKELEALQKEILEQQAVLTDQSLELEEKRKLKKGHDTLLKKLEHLKGFVNERLGIDAQTIKENQVAIEKSFSGQEGG